MYRILLIDDRPALRRDAGDALSALGHAVVTVDAAEAMAALDRQSFDVVMAGVESGVPASRERAAPTIPDNVVYLPKPFTIDDVVHAVHAIAERESVRDELERARLSK